MQRINKKIARNNEVISRLENSLQQENLGSDSKRLKEEHDFYKARADSLETANEALQKEMHLHVICTICNERPKNKGIQCGHRFCQECLDEWKKAANTCPLCNEVIKSVFPSFN